MNRLVGLAVKSKPLVLRVACACVSAQPCQTMPLSLKSLPSMVHSRKPNAVSEISRALPPHLDRSAQGVQVGLVRPPELWIGPWVCKP